MPHQRARYLEPVIKKALAFSPIVGVLGQRQTGKTTLVSRLASDYVSLDQRAELARAEENPELLIADHKKPFALDECQLAPALFPALKEFVRLHPGKGQFILTGSIRFTSRKAIRESLTGRIFNLELLPFSWAESSELPLSELPDRIVKGSLRSIQDYLDRRKAARLHGSVETFLSTGGLPGICFQRDEGIRSGKFESHIETLLDRDLRLLVSTRLRYSSLRALLASLALLQGSPLDLSELSRKSRISRPTLRNLLSSFESMFLLRLIPAQGGTARPVILFEDQGLATHLVRGIMDPQIDLWRALFANIYPQFAYRNEWNAGFSHYLTRGGARVPIVVESKRGILGYLPEIDSGASGSAIGSARSFLKAHPGAKAIIAHQGREVAELAPGLFSLPLRLCV